MASYNRTFMTILIKDNGKHWMDEDVDADDDDDNDNNNNYNNNNNNKH